ncbi:MAG: tyrosine-type recombinase/integrase, partial [Clostridiaceae bacterium]|nr:tyrosine-type recombinase/integrase [Clostridiaceae bacterium]
YGRYFDSTNIRKRFNKIIDNINNNEPNENKKIKHRKFHDLRHTYATRLFELGEEPKTVQKLLGHANLSITMDTYTHVLEEVKRNAVSKLDNLYNSMNK